MLAGDAFMACMCFYAYANNFCMDKMFSKLSTFWLSISPRKPKNVLLFQKMYMILFLWSISFVHLFIVCTLFWVRERKKSTSIIQLLSIGSFLAHTRKDDDEAWELNHKSWNKGRHRRVFPQRDIAGFCLSETEKRTSNALEWTNDCLQAHCLNDFCQRSTTFFSDSFEVAGYWHDIPTEFWLSYSQKNAWIE